MKFVRLAVAVGVCLAPACNKPAAPATAPATAPTVPSAPTTKGGTTTRTPSDEAAAEATARAAGYEFLTALKAGRAAASGLTPEFKALVAAGAGAPDWAAQHWLDEFKGDPAAVAAQVYLPLGDSLLVAATAIGGADPKPTTYCKMVRTPGASKYAVAWLHTSPLRPRVELLTDTAAKFVAVAFVDTLLTKQTPLAVSLLAPSALKRFAPPLDADDEKLGYNRGLLGLKLGNFRESFTSVTYGVATKAGPNLALSGELTGPGAERCKFTVTVAPAGSGWLVEDFRHD